MSASPPRAPIGKDHDAKERVIGLSLPAHRWRTRRRRENLGGDAARVPKEGTIIEGAKTMSAHPGSRTEPPADADDLGVEQIAAQLGSPPYSLPPSYSPSRRSGQAAHHLAHPIARPHTHRRDRGQVTAQSPGGDPRCRGRQHRAVLLQGSLVADDVIAEAGISAPLKAAKNDQPQKTIMGWGRSVGKRRRRFQH